MCHLSVKEKSNDFSGELDKNSNLKTKAAATKRQILRAFQ
jgi:hypothetical protein